MKRDISEWDQNKPDFLVWFMSSVLQLWKKRNKGGVLLYLQELKSGNGPLKTLLNPLFIYGVSDQCICMSMSFFFFFLRAETRKSGCAFLAAFFLLIHSGDIIWLLWTLLSLLTHQSMEGWWRRWRAEQWSFWICLIQKLNMWFLFL